jgi:hypothetical protein
MAAVISNALLYPINLMKQNINRQALDHIKVWECVVETLDQDPALQIKRVLTDEEDKLVISSIWTSEPKEGEVSINTDSADILAAALELMYSDE